MVNVKHCASEKPGGAVFQTVFASVILITVYCTSNPRESSASVKSKTRKGLHTFPNLEEFSEFVSLFIYRTLQESYFQV